MDKMSYFLSLSRKIRAIKGKKVSKYKITTYTHVDTHTPTNTLRYVSFKET